MKGNNLLNLCVKLHTCLVKMVKCNPRHDAHQTIIDLCYMWIHGCSVYTMPKKINSCLQGIVTLRLVFFLVHVRNATRKTCQKKEKKGMKYFCMSRLMRFKTKVNCCQKNYCHGNCYNKVITKLL
jgi:hypothetical protein